jgi:hypothetical protein
MYLLNWLSNKTIRESCPYVALHGVAPSYEHLWMFSCVCYPNLSAQAPHKLPPGPPDVPSSDVLPITNAIGVSISTNNIIVSRHVVFYEIDFSFIILPRLINDLDIFLQDNSCSAAPMPASLMAPPTRVPTLPQR